MDAAARRLRLLSVWSLALLSAASGFGRVLSYAPYSDRPSFPILQHRMNRHFALIETVPVNDPTTPILPIGLPGITGQLVLYDSKGEEEPRVIFPPNRVATNFTVAAMREDARGMTILIQTNFDFEGKNPTRRAILLITTDGGTTWKRVNIATEPDTVTQLPSWSIDVGGPFARSRYSPVRIGTAEYPFVISTKQALYAIDAAGKASQLLPPVLVNPPVPFLGATLVGSNAAGSRFLVRVPGSADLFIVNLDGANTPVGTLQSGTSTVEGWITPSGFVYVDERIGTTSKTISIFSPSGTRTEIASSTSSDPISLFAIPTHDFTGAWLIQRGGGRPTVLSRHAPNGPLVEQWSDITAPEVEALHAAASGQSLLIQVHRPRPQFDQRIFMDPALAIWKIGDPAPNAYDELFMNELPTKGFVHLDVDAMAAGETFVFDSGAQPNNPGIIVSPPVSAPPVAGGGDVIQEWGVVRSSLKQRLILPGIGRTPGAYSSFWSSDVIFYNPLSIPQKVTLRYVPNGDVTTAALVNDLTLTLDPREIRVVRDALKSLFGLEFGSGATFITPEYGLNVTSRTYSKDPTKSHGGTFGFSMNAIDVYTAASPRFPVSFSGAFPGSEYRTNMIVTDVSGRGSATTLTATGFLGPMGASGVTLSAAPFGQQQYNNLAATLGLGPSDVGGLVVQPTRGEAIASVFTIDNKTNDPTYFPPDLPSPIVRTIPAIGHLDGANNSRFRSDLFLFNPSNQVRTLNLQITPWDDPRQSRTIFFTMLPNESRVIRDVLMRLFGRTGIARLRYQSWGDPTGIRVTSRTYSIDDNGGTFGFIMPPFNAFQTASPGDTLEILGVTGGVAYRTNIGIIDMAAFPGTMASNVRIEIIDDKGKTIDSFTTNVPSAGGMQLNDIFRARNLGAGPTAALIKVSPLSGLIGAYATVTDNDTNDGVYLAANLGAHQ